LDDGFRICYLTNNSTRSSRETLEQAVSNGFPEAPVIGSAFAASMLLKESKGPVRCLVLGESGLSIELERAGHRPVMAGKGEGGPFDALVAGLDRTLTYQKLAEGLGALRSGALFIATNEDPTLPVEGGRVLPGAGAITGALRAASGKIPLVAGKPEPYSTLMAARELELPPVDVLVVGDRPDMDGEAAIRAGCRAAIVMTGEDRPGVLPEIPRYRDLSALSRSLLDHSFR
jgi:4-nitrophenyl phosphatase